MKHFKNPISVRGDMLYCPLPVAIDSYWNCLVDCHHCYFRRLNHTWGKELRPARPSEIKRRLLNGLNNASPKTALAHALRQKKTIRIGNKSDPLQPVEKKMGVTKRIISIMTELSWSYVIQTRFTQLLLEYEKHLLRSHKSSLLTLLPVISPGLNKDYEILEKSLTTPPEERMKHASYFLSLGFPVGVQGEPFIPGYHTVKDFETTVRLLVEHGITRYNTYNFHFNAFVAKRLNAIGIDIEKIWRMNQDENWRPILRQLLDIAKKYDIILGNPDFVNTGPNWYEKANTCCGIDVPNPCTFNTHNWKGYLQEGRGPGEVFDLTWDGIGDREEGKHIIEGTRGCKFYTMRDAGMIGDPDE